MRAGGEERENMWGSVWEKKSAAEYSFELTRRGHYYENN